MLVAALSVNYLKGYLQQYHVPLFKNMGESCIYKSVLKVISKFSILTYIRSEILIPTRQKYLGYKEC